MRHHGSARRRPRVLYPMLLLAVIGALAARLAHRIPLPAERLNHANAQEAGEMVNEQLQHTPDEQRVTLLLHDLDSSSPGMRYAALDALGNRRGQEVTRAVEAAFTDNASAVRELALESLPRLDAERGWLLLCAGLRDGDTQIRIDAANQIASLTNRANTSSERRIVPALIQALDDPNLMVVSMIEHALCRITGKTWKDSSRATQAERAHTVTEWRQWWEGAQNRWPVPPQWTQVAARLPMRQDPASELDVTDVDGGRFSLPAQRGQIVLLNFWGTWCPPCRQELPDLQQVQMRYGGHGVLLLGLAINEKQSGDGLKAWCRTNGLTYRQALCPTHVQDAWGDIEGVPISVLIDRQGRVRYRWEGPRDIVTFAAAIDQLLAE